MRLGFIAINSAIIATGTAHFPVTVPLVCAACLVGLLVLVVRAHRKLWAMDMENKAGSECKSSERGSKGPERGR